MLTLPNDIMPIIGAFRQVFSERVWDWAQILLVGSILAPPIRTVTSALRVMGLSQDKQFQNFHRVLNRAKWSGLTASKILLGLLIAAFIASDVPLILGADETLERRRGKHITAKSVFRDAVRSSKKHTVYSFGLRWISLMLLVPVPWSRRAWALPFLTVLAPSAKTNAAVTTQRIRTFAESLFFMVSLSRGKLLSKVLEHGCNFCVNRNVRMPETVDPVSLARTVG